MDFVASRQRRQRTRNSWGWGCDNGRISQRRGKLDLFSDLRSCFRFELDPLFSEINCKLLSISFCQFTHIVHCAFRIDSHVGNSKL